MKTITSVRSLAVLGAGLMAGVLVLAMWLTGGSGGPAQAQTPITVGFDMDTTGNSCPGDGVTNCSLGTIDNCVWVPSSGGVITIDVFLDGLPQLPDQPDEGGIVTFAYHIGEKDGLTVGTISAYTHDDILVNLLLQQPNGLPSNVQEFSDPVGISVPCWNAAIGELADVEYNPVFTKGVLTRLEINVPAGTPDGIYGLTIDPPGTTAPLILGEVAADDYCNPASPVYVGCDILDALDSYGLIAKGDAVSCPLPADPYIKSQEVRAGDCSGSPPATMPVDTDTDVCLRKVLRQDDVSTLDVSVTPSVTPPGDCTAIFKTGPATATLPQNTDVTVDEVYTINCSAASTHAFSFDNAIAITSADLYDSDPGNNTASTPMAINVTAQADVEVTAVTVDAPDTHPVGFAFSVSVSADVTNNGPYEPVQADVTIDLDLSSAPDCAKNPDSSWTLQDLSLGSASPSATWSVTCTTTGIKTFNGSATAAITDPHISDPTPGNNSRSTPPGSDSTDVGPSTDVEAVSWSFPDDLPSIAGNQVIVVPTTPEVIQSTQVIQNNGGTYTDPVATDDDKSVADTAECDVDPNADSDSFDLAVGVPQEVVDDWTVTWTEMARPPYSCTLFFEKHLTVTEPGVTDHNDSNNTDSVSVVLVRDSDGDTVVDNYEGIVDNCPDDDNPGQTNTDVIVNPPGDALGDACDPDDDNDGHEDQQEETLGSDPLDPGSTPEHSSLPDTCFDGVDNDLDGLYDGYDPDCDHDADGIPNWIDACFAIPEDMDGYEDADGCPEFDNDMDGICDPWFEFDPPTLPVCEGVDGCPNVVEDIDDFWDEDGCPDPDNDGDGFPDWTDDCPGTDWTGGTDRDPATLDDNPLDELGLPIDTREDYDGIIDWDGCHDSPEDDWDGDGVADEVEVFVAGTDPANMDSDNDGLCDGYRPPICVSEDANNNGVVDPGESDPLNPDTDGDGLTDGLERGLTAPETPDTDVSSPNWQPDADPLSTTDPLSEDSDGDGIPDGSEDSNQDGRVDRDETDPADGDTDDDGYGDAADNCPARFNPDQEDFDLDGTGDHCDDSDLDLFTDYLELFVGTDPLDDCPDDLSDNAWPPDFKNDGNVNILDVVKYRLKLEAWGYPYDPRYDLTADSHINILDIVKLRPVFGTWCTNP